MPLYFQSTPPAKVYLSEYILMIQSALLTYLPYISLHTPKIGMYFRILESTLNLDPEGKIISSELYKNIYL